MTTFDLDNVRWRPARNDSGEDIPAHAAVRLKSFDTTTGEFVVEAPTGNSTTSRIGANGPVMIPTGASGLVSFDWPNYLRYSTGSGEGGTPQLNDMMGTVAGEFELSNGKAGFVCLANAETGNQRVFVMPGMADEDGTGAGELTTQLQLIEQKCVGSKLTDTTITVTFPGDVLVTRSS